MSAKKKFEETILPPVPAKKVKTSVTSLPTTTTRKKTGGRVRLTLEKKLELAAQRSKIASFHDDTTLEPELAALYLGISEKKLEELRRATTNARQHTSHRIPFYKIFDHDALGQNQPILYKLGDLRYFRSLIKVTDSHEAAVNAGLASWVFVNRQINSKNKIDGDYIIQRLLTSFSKKQPYFLKREKDGSRSIIINAWDIDSVECAEGEKNLLDFITGKIDIKFYSFAQASIQVWTNYLNHANHNNFFETHLQAQIYAMRDSVSKSRAIRSKE